MNNNLMSNVAQENKQIGWSREQMAQRCAQDIEDGNYVNLGIGIPEKVAQYVPAGREVIYHTENGLLGMGTDPSSDELDPDLINAGKKPVTAIPGAAYFHHGDSFSMIRGKHIDVCVLGAMQVSEKGDLANWSTGAPDAIPAVGGAMDLVAGVKTIYIITQHTTKTGAAKILSECSFPLTGKGVVNRIYSDLCVIDVTNSGLKVIDLSADFRLKDADLWAKWYNQPHGCPELIAQAVYGLPEVNRAEIKGANLIACPGCYPTAIQLGFLPLLENKLVDSKRLIADAKSGVSGAGRAANVGTLLSECADSFKAYGASGHRHSPEIRQGLNQFSGDQVSLTFVPHLVPMIRGIEATLYAELTTDLSLEDIQSLYEQRYKDEPFVDVMPLGSSPETRSVKGSNYCRIALHQQPDSNVIIVLSVIDNLVKGASGQAVQNMNLMFGLDERAGINQVPLMP